MKPFEAYHRTCINKHENNVIIIVFHLAIEKMRKEMEEEIRQQLMSNQAQLDAQESGGQTWEAQVNIQMF